VLDDVGVPVVRAANLGLKFLLELAAFAAFAYWGANVADGALSLVLAIVAPVVAIALWGRLAAPRSPRRLPAARRIPFELAVFALAVAGLLWVGVTAAAIVLAALVTANSILLTAFRQWGA
jgi:hypothetical protein